MNMSRIARSSCCRITPRSHRVISLSRRSGRAHCAGQGFGSRTSKETTIDELVDNIVNLYKDGQVNALADVTLKNIRRFDQDLWMNIADRTDNAQSDEERQVLSTLASTVRVVWFEA